MSQATLGEVLRYLRTTCDPQHTHDLTDAALLERFLRQREEAAFAILVQRHGPMVLAVCRRLCGNDAAAEDAFQATFLVLVRRAGSIRKWASLGSWLYGVARHIASRARTQAATRQHHERRCKRMPPAEPLDDLTWQELRTVLDDEVGRLPEQYRAAIVSCYLEGQSYEQAAHELGWPKSSVANRLARAREMLRKQLVRRGITLSGGVLAAALGENAGGVQVTARLIIDTVKAAAAIAAGKALAADLFSTHAVALAEEAMKPMHAFRRKFLVALLALGLAVIGGSLAAQFAPTEQSLPASTESAPVAGSVSVGPPKPDPVVTADAFGDPLPEGVVARLGTVRFRHAIFTTKVAFAFGGKVLASAGGDLQGFDIRLWDTTTGKLLQRLPGTGGSSRLAISADGKLLLTDNFQLFDIAAGKQLQRFKGPTHPAGSVAFSPDGRLVAAGESAGQSRVFVWEVNTGKELHRLEGHSGMVSSVAFSSDSKTVASGSADKTVRLWDVATGKELRRFEGVEKAVNAVAFAPVGKVLAAADDEGVVRLWDADTGKLLHRLTGDKDLAFSPNGKLLASASNEGTVHLWDTDSGKELRRWVVCRWGLGGLTSIAFAPDGKALASAGMHDHGIRLWDPATGTEIRPFAGHTGVVVSLWFAASGKTLFSSGDDNCILEWDTTTGRERDRLFGGSGLGPPHPGWAWRAHDLSRDGKVLAVVGSVPTSFKQVRVDTAIRLLDTATGKELCSLKSNEYLRTLRLSPDGKLLAADGQDGIHVWNTSSGKEILCIKGQRSHRGSLVFSPDASQLAWAGDADRTVHVWDVAAVKEIRQWQTLQEKTRVLAISPDGKYLAGAGREDVRVWAVATGKQLAQFRGQAPAWILSLAFSPSGRVLAAGAERPPDNGAGGEAASSIYLWEIPSNQEIQKIAGPQGSVTALAFAPDGRTLASGGVDSTILLWDLTGSVRSGKSKPAPWTAAELDKLWSDLAEDAAKADRALRALAGSPKQSVPSLKERLRPVMPADGQQLAELIADLDSKDFALREQATRKLAELGEAAEAALRKTLQGNPTLEVRQRLELLLQKRSRDALRQLRAVEALEYIGTPEARQVLEALAKTAPNPQVAQAARAALERLAQRLAIQS
jgi:RNA polymerase sigma factor (sigma-70 family)